LPEALNAAVVSLSDSRLVIHCDRNSALDISIQKIDVLTRTPGARRQGASGERRRAPDLAKRNSRARMTRRGRLARQLDHKVTPTVSSPMGMDRRAPLRGIESHLVNMGRVGAGRKGQNHPWKPRRILGAKTGDRPRIAPNWLEPRRQTLDGGRGDRLQNAKTREKSKGPEKNRLH
jgi:hypothetical protein